MSRSELVYRAAKTTACRFELVRATAKATRAIHRPQNQRLAESINQALEFIADPSAAARVLSRPVTQEQVLGISDGLREQMQDEAAVPYSDLYELQEPQY